MFNPIKKVKTIIDNKVSDVKKNNEDFAKLQRWREKFVHAKNHLNMEMFDTREKLYLGTQQVLPNANNPKNPNKAANNVINIHYEFTETMIDSTIPQPSVRNRRSNFSDQAKMIEDSIKNDLVDMDIDRINDTNERTTQIQGFSMVMVEWDPDYQNHLYRGELKFRNIHPKQFVGQPGVYSIDDMDYYFIMFSVTKQYVLQRYGVDLRNKNEEYPDINILSDNTLEKASRPNSLNDKVTEIVCFYKDDDGDVCKFTFSCDQVLEDLPKYYDRRFSKCLKCGKPEEQCNCKNPKIAKESMDGEVLESDTQIGNGEVLHEGDIVPFFSPKMYPISVRINTPANFEFGGQSDIDVVRDQQDAIKKMTTAIEEKILKGGSVITAPDTMPISLTNQLYQIIKGTPQELASIRNINLEANVGQDLEVIRFMYESARDTLGITNAFQGKPDNTAISGKAKQINVQQSSGRLQSKLFNKYIFYKRLFEIMFFMKLAFYDELRPYVYKDEDGKDQYGDFNKYMFIDRDSAGELYYVTEFSISADAGAGLPKDKMWILDMYMNLYKEHVLTPVQLLKVLTDLQLMGSSELLKQAEKMQEEAQQAQIAAQQQAQAAAAGQQPGAVPGAVPGGPPGAAPPQPGPDQGQMPPADQQPPPDQGGPPQQDQRMFPEDTTDPAVIKRKVQEYLFSKMSPKEIQEFVDAPPKVQIRAIVRAMQEMNIQVPDKLMKQIEQNPKEELQ